MPLHPDDPSASSPSYVHPHDNDDPGNVQAYADKCAFYSGMPVYVTERVQQGATPRPFSITEITPSLSREMVSPCAVTEGGHIDPCGCAPAPPL